MTFTYPAEVIKKKAQDRKIAKERIEKLEAALKQFGPIDTLLMDIWDTAHSASIVNRDMHDPAQVRTLLARIANAANEARKLAKAALEGGDA